MKLNLQCEAIYQSSACYNSNHKVAKGENFDILKGFISANIDICEDVFKATALFSDYFSND